MSQLTQFLPLQCYHLILQQRKVLALVINTTIATQVASEQGERLLGLKTKDKNKHTKKRHSTCFQTELVSTIIDLHISVLWKKDQNGGKGIISYFILSPVTEVPTLKL